MSHQAKTLLWMIYNLHRFQPDSSMGTHDLPQIFNQSLQSPTWRFSIGAATFLHVESFYWSANNFSSNRSNISRFLIGYLFNFSRLQMEVAEGETFHYLTFSNTWLHLTPINMATSFTGLQQTYIEVHTLGMIQSFLKYESFKQMIIINK